MKWFDITSKGHVFTLAEKWSGQLQSQGNVLDIAHMKQSVYRSHIHCLPFLCYVLNSLSLGEIQQKPLICCSRSYWAVYSLCGEGNDWEPSQSLVPAMQWNTYLDKCFEEKKIISVLAHWVFYYIAKIDIGHIHPKIYSSD